MTNTNSIHNSSNARGKYRILLVVRWPGGGIRTFIRYVYRHFEPELFQLTILGPNDPEMNVLLEDLNDLDVDLKRVSERPSSYEFFKAVFKLIAFGNYDLVHSQGFTSGICSALPAFLAKKPHVLTSHDVLSEVQFNGMIGKLKKIGMGIAFSMIDRIHSVSYDAQENFFEFFPSLGKTTGKCVVIRNGIEVERFVNAAHRELRNELGVGEEVFLIGFLGRFMSQKGFNYLVDAMQIISKNKNQPKNPIVIAFGEDGFIREEKAQIANRGLEKYFRFLPFTPNVAGVIKALDVVVMPSLWEACPLLAMEVLVVGTPLIATDCVGLREVVRNTPTYVISSKNGKALAEGIESFINHDNKAIFNSFSKNAAIIFDVKDQAIKLKQIIFEEVGYVHK